MVNDIIFSDSFYYGVVGSMFCLAPIVFFALQFVSAGYGMMYTPKWGPTVSNRVGWVLMESPVFIAMVLFWLLSPRRWDAAPMVMCLFFLMHYFQRSFIFPFMIKGKGKMPLTIVAMGILFNLINSYMIGGWLFYVAPVGYYTADWFLSPCFLVGTAVFFVGMWINVRSDSIVRHLRKPGDTRHYIPRGGMYRYVTSANYFGEFVEWTGYAVLTWSLGGAAFALWTFANLAPRARKLHARYLSEFGEEYKVLNRRYILPFIY